MIQIEDKAKCCGCGACVQRCPKNCILLKEDGEGFLYPVVDKDNCVDCGLCEKVCPVLNQGEERKPLYVYAAKNEDEEIRKKSSSGGVFTLLAVQVIKNGGVVFGARFNENWEVVHDYSETEEGLSAFRGSKYVQSKIGETYKQVEEFLREGREVMFSGTPCQISGLKLFLGKRYENLLTVDVICHGVSSPMIWRMYLKELLARQGDGKNSVLSHSIPPFLKSIRDISCIDFRNKELGWKKYSFALTLSVPSNGHGVKNTVLLSEPYTQNLYMKGFLSDLYLRPSCHACPTKSLKSGADITLGDFWGIQNIFPDIDDDMGVSAVLLNTEKGVKCYTSLKLQAQEMCYDDVLRYNPAICKSSLLPQKREIFWNMKGKSVFFRVEKLCRISYLLILKSKIKILLSLFDKKHNVK